MSVWKKSSGWGNVQIGGLPFTGSGKVFVVGDSGTANLGMLQELFNTDNDGDVRFHATLDAAVGACTASAGDLILVMPGHTEAVTATSIDLDVAGITVVCLGNQENQAVFTYGAAASTISVGAANITFVGGVHQATFADVASAFTVGAATGFRLQGGKFEDTGASLNFLSIVTTGAVANQHDGLQVVGNTFYGLHATPLAFISILEATKDLLIQDNFIDSAATALMECVTFAAFDSLGTRIIGNTLVKVGATDTTIGIFLTGSGTAHTGIVAGNKVSSLDTTTELIATAGTGLVYFENYYTGVADKSGKLWPVVDAA